MENEKRAATGHPINDLLARRWSPRAFEDKPVARGTLARLFEAARWAPSCFNEQPWRYVIAFREDPDRFERLASLLSEGNAWARKAAVLALSVAHLSFQRNGKPNRHAWHDVGAATENLCLQAVECGLRTHQMAGFDRERAREMLGLDDAHEPVAMIAIGYPGDPSVLPEKLRERELAPRERRPLAAFVFEGGWERPARLEE